MMADLSKLDKYIADRWKTTRRVLKAQAIVFSLLGSAIVAIGGALLGGLHWPPTPGQLFVYLGAILGLIGGVGYRLIDSSGDDGVVQEARTVLISNQNREKKLEEYADLIRLLYASTTQLRALYTFVNSCRGIVETAEFLAT